MDSKPYQTKVTTVFKTLVLFVKKHIIVLLHHDRQSLSGVFLPVVSTAGNVEEQEALVTNYEGLPPLQRQTLNPVIAALIHPLTDSFTKFSGHPQTVSHHSVEGHSLACSIEPDVGFPRCQMRRAADGCPPASKRDTNGWRTRTAVLSACVNSWPCSCGKDTKNIAEHFLWVVLFQFDTTVNLHVNFKQVQ